MRVVDPVDIVTNTEFSRATVKSYFNSSGLRASAAIDEVAVTYNPSTLECEGISVELAATNYCLRANDFASGSWGKVNASSGAVPTRIGADGAVSMWPLIPNALSTSHYFDQGIASGTFAIGSVVVCAIDVAVGSQPKAGIQFYADTGNASTAIFFDFATETFTTSTSAGGSGTGVIIAADFQKLQNGVYRIWIANTMPVETGRRIRVGGYTAANSNNYLGDALTPAVYLSSCQVELDDAPTSFILTLGAIAGRTPDILGDMLTSTVPEPDTSMGEVEWNSLTNYALNSYVIRKTTHKKYRNTQAGVDATLPEVDAALTEPTRWVESGSTNRYAMISTKYKLGTTAPSPLSIGVVIPKRVQSIGVVGMVGDVINIKLLYAGGVKYNFTQKLSTRNVLSFTDYCFAPFSNTPNVVRFNLPPYSSGQIIVTITSRTGTVKCGAVLIGNYTDIGSLQYGVRIQNINNTLIERQIDTLKVTKRPTKPKLSGVTIFNKPQTSKILALKEALNGKTALWVGLDDDFLDDYASGLTIVGLYRIFDVVIDYPVNPALDLEIEET